VADNFCHSSSVNTFPCSSLRRMAEASFSAIQAFAQYAPSDRSRCAGSAKSSSPTHERNFPDRHLGWAATNHTPQSRWQSIRLLLGFESCRTNKHDVASRFFRRNPLLLRYAANRQQPSHVVFTSSSGTLGVPLTAPANRS